MKINFRIYLALYCGAVFILTAAVLWQPPVYAAELDDIYPPFLTKHKFFYQSEFSSFNMSEDGSHGSASFGHFESSPSLTSASHSLRSSPFSNFEVEAGYGQVFPQEYTRLTYDGPTPALDAEQVYKLNHFQDYSLNLRLRKGLFEPYLMFQEKRQKAKSDSILLLDDTISFDDISSHYEDLELGIRYLSKEKTAQVKDGYFQLVRPLLAGKQINVEVKVGFKNGKVNNSSDIYVGNTLFIREYLHQLRPHYIPAVLLRYGINDRLEVESGFSYTTPFKYNYEFRQFNPTSSNFITAAYSFENNFKAPLKFTYRPANNISVTFSSDFNYVKQRVDSWEKETDDSITQYDTRKLKYYNTKPTLELSYFYGADKQISGDDFSFLTKQMLRRKQVLMGFKYQKDITSLKKADGNNAQNVIDPYGLFLYPLEFFVSGTEYASFFLVHKTAEVQPQNFYLLETSLTYGLRDYLNVGLEVGYRSGSSLHHFTVQDMASRFYRFTPFYYFNFLADWRIKKNSSLSLRVHYVPQYKTFLETTIHPKQFEDETRYYEVSLAWKILF